MKSWLIEDLETGAIGVWQGDTPLEALDSMVRDRGYSGWLHACSVAGNGFPSCEEDVDHLRIALIQGDV